MMMHFQHCIISTLLFLSALTVPCLSEWRGGDMTLTPDVESWGGVFRDEKGNQQDPVDIFADNGFNVARIHMFVEPEGKCCNTQEGLELAKRYHRRGVKIYLALHFSDTWANPGTQEKPKAWKNLSFEKLTWELRKYTRDTLNTFYGAGINPIAVQLGNEMAGGILYPDGKVWGNHNSDWHWRNLGYLLGNATQGVYDAADPKKKPVPALVLHTEHGGQYSKSQWFFKKLKETSTYDDYDTIGLSFYPWWQGTIDGLKDNIRKLKGHAIFSGKDVAVVETGYPWTLEQNDKFNNNFVDKSNQLHAGYPATPTGQKNFIKDVRKVAAEEGALGVLYWAPDWINAGLVGGKWENAALFDFNGRALPGLKEMGRALSSPQSPPPPPPPPRTPSPTPKPAHNPPPPAPQQSRPSKSDEWRGADVTHFLEAEKKGVKFRNKHGIEQPLPRILADSGINLARIRLFHNPKDGQCCSLDEAVTIAKRMDDVDIGIQIDFQFSDEDARPGHQMKPAEWKWKNFRELCNAIQTYTNKVMWKFRNVGIMPVSVQLGNDIGGGMLETNVWGNGDTTEQWSKIGTMLKRATAGIREASSGKKMPKIVIHHDDGANGSATNWFFGSLLKHYNEFDVIGVSFYSIWKGGNLGDLKGNLNDLSNRGKELAVMETGYPYRNNQDNLISGYPATETGQGRFVKDLRNIVASVPGGLGVVYYSPEWVTSWWANKALFDANGKALPSLEALGGKSVDSSSSISSGSQQTSRNEAGELVTTLDSNTGTQGAQFDIVAKKDVIIQGFDINAMPDTYTAEVYTKVGGYAGSEKNRDDWKLIQTTKVTSKGTEQLTSLANLPEPLRIRDGDKQAFYIRLLTPDGDRLRLTRDQQEGRVFKQDDNIEFLVGVGISNWKDNGFGWVHRKRVFNGCVRYETD